MFDGATYDPDLDGPRLGKQAAAVWAIMRDGDWHTPREIALHLGCSDSSASARMRDFRKSKFGGHTVERERVEGGVWRYRLIVRTGDPEQMELAV